MTKPNSFIEEVVREFRKQFAKRLRATISYTESEDLPKDIKSFIISSIKSDRERIKKALLANKLEIDIERTTPFKNDSGVVWDEIKKFGFNAALDTAIGVVEDGE